MAYDEALAERIRDELTAEPGITERKMFGGLSFLRHGHMVCGVVKSEFCARVGVEATDDALAQPHTRPMDFTGKPMRGMVFVDPTGVESDADLRAWIGRGLAYARTLPPKT